MENSKVSIIIPVYNCEKYLKKCFDSVKIQSYKNIEAIIINDGSKDGSLKIINKYIKENKNWKLIDQKNQGLSNSRNNGYKLATGKYIFFLDSDDELPSNSIEKLVTCAEKNQSDVVIGNMLNYNSSGFFPNYTTKFIRQADDIDYDKFPELISFIHAAGKLYSKKVIENLEFIPDVKHEDNYFNLSLYLRKVKISMIKDDVYYHRIREGEERSITQSLNYSSFLDLMKNYERLISENDFNYALCKIFGKKIYNYIAKYVESENVELAIKKGKTVIKKFEAKSNLNFLSKIYLEIYLKLYLFVSRVYRTIKVKGGKKNG